jgi:hypothetical protein
MCRKRNILRKKILKSECRIFFHEIYFETFQIERIQRAATSGILYLHDPPKPVILVSLMATS